jgi:hypothetical protein
MRSRKFLAAGLALALACGLAAPAWAQLGMGLIGPSSAVSGGGGAFTFTDRPSAVTSTAFTSNTITAPAGSISITGSGCQYSVNGGAFTSSGGSVSAGDSVAVKGTSSASLNTTLDCALTIGAASDTYTITTVVNTEADAFLKRVSGAAGISGARGRAL